jgi:hypothetical protein
MPFEKTPLKVDQAVRRLGLPRTRMVVTVGQLNLIRSSNTYCNSPLDAFAAVTDGDAGSQ